jgi:hypothetical protein
MKSGNKKSYLRHADFLLGLFFDTEDGGDMFLRNVGFFQLTARRCILEIEPFITTAVIPSDST